MGAFASLQKAIYTALLAETELTALVETRVYDDVPHGSAGGAPVFPFVTIGEQVISQDGAGDVDLGKFQFAVHVWSRKAGRLECLQLIDAVCKALHWSKGYAIEGGKVLDLAYAAHETMREPDLETYHGVARFEGILQMQLGG